MILYKYSVRLSLPKGIFHFRKCFSVFVQFRLQSAFHFLLQIKYPILCVLYFAHCGECHFLKQIFPKIFLNRGCRIRRFFHGVHQLLNCSRFVLKRYFHFAIECFGEPFQYRCIAFWQRKFYLPVHVPAVQTFQEF